MTRFDEQKKNVSMNDVVQKQAGYFENMTTKEDIVRELMILEKLRNRLQHFRLEAIYSRNCVSCFSSEGKI